MNKKEMDIVEKIYDGVKDTVDDIGEIKITDYSDHYGIEFVFKRDE